MIAHRLSRLSVFIACATLPVALRSANTSSRTERGNSVAEILACLKTGIDGFFTNDPVVGREAVRVFTGK